MPRARFSAWASVLIALAWGPAAGEVFLGQGGRDNRDFDAELRAAMGSVMGCGAPAGAESHAQVDAVKLTLTPMWETLPKNRWGRVEWRALRHAAHRYFLQKSSLLVRGFEPNRLVNSSEMGTAEIFVGEAKSVVDTILRGKVNGQGFTLDDAAFMLATLQQVIYDTESVRLERAYTEKNYNPAGALTHDSLATVIEAYMMLWMIGDDEETIAVLFRHPDQIHLLFPQWDQVRDFAVGMVKKMEFEASVRAAAGKGRASMELSYSFADAHQAVGYITHNFASFWEAECQTIKTSLVAMDKLGIGRVAISDFYGANADGEWRFGESETYLRELGALDETSSPRGKQVIIPNYLLGASNCIVATTYYMVCCVNECEGVLNDIQGGVGAPVASPQAILALVASIEGYDDESPALEGTLTAQLERIAQMHGGHVPLHGRLFAQWLHYVFPRECPYPHKAGTTSAASIHEFGDASYASDIEVRSYSASRRVASEEMSSADEAQWMSQWSEEEELPIDDGLGVAPWERTGTWLRFGCASTALLGVAWTLGAGALEGVMVGGEPQSSSGHKTHFV